ncbi:MAG: phosphoribosylglycinamide formyltransferase [Proteobacteria bacterium]|nr:phosphoribosylglycinamide formyltransferase [Pseudomonadota bacterium]
MPPLPPSPRWRASACRRGRSARSCRRVLNACTSPDFAVFDVVVLASGRGSNFAALLGAQQRGELPIRIHALLSDKFAAPALDIARAAGIAAIAVTPRDFPDRAAFDRALFAQAALLQPDLIVLAGYMRMIDAAVVQAWAGKIINIHPSLLPKYPGLRTHQRALDAGDAVHGASVHFVTAQLDGGPVFAQARMPILAGDTADTLAARLLPLEHRLLAASVGLIARGRIARDGDGVTLDGVRLDAPLQLQDDATLRAVG